MVKHKRSWNLPFDERIIPDIFSFKYPKSPWVRLFLFVEMAFAILVVLGTLLLVLISPMSPFGSQENTSASTTSATY